MHEERWSSYIRLSDPAKLLWRTTSVLGMIPLAIFPGQGSELYQGLGIALVGGLAFSTLLTPTVVPALMALLHDFSNHRRRF
ncbi:MAG: hypothetical protein C6Y22_30380 [Hapalosiphonaceae cyanobacterium JJU2]|nr:MAG: hypothetical protein C6Y22_30380 [Hapalosiphonaceae cyanobacterium JJU2]